MSTTADKPLAPKKKTPIGVHLVAGTFVDIPCVHSISSLRAAVLFKRLSALRVFLKRTLLTFPTSCFPSTRFTDADS